MKAKLDASRTLLYETARFVDVYKTYMHIAEERSLEKEEREEMKKYQKLADFYTPLAKGISSEFCNQLAYDAIQIHGGSGFMKDYPLNGFTVTPVSLLFMKEPRNYRWLQLFVGLQPVLILTRSVAMKLKRFRRNWNIFVVP